MLNSFRLAVANVQARPGTSFRDIDRTVFKTRPGDQCLEDQNGCFHPKSLQATGLGQDIPAIATPNHNMRTQIGFPHQPDDLETAMIRYVYSRGTRSEQSTRPKHSLKTFSDTVLGLTRVGDHRRVRRRELDLLNHMYRRGMESLRWGDIADLDCEL